MQFKFTNTQRTRKSFEGFATGLFGRHNIRSVTYDKPLNRDPILRFYKRCSKWKNEVKKNPETYREQNLFVNTSKIVQKAVGNIANKLGIPLEEFSFDDAFLMYITCAYETSMYRNIFSPWCSIFDNHTIKVFEFSEDLKYYWVDGYGFTLTYNQACPAIKDMLDKINPTSISSTSTVYFTHSGTVLKLVAKLGLYKDKKPLYHTDFENNRQWRVSKIDAFASNIFFITFECDDIGYKVLVIHQERPIKIPGCDYLGDSFLCSLDIFIKLFEADKLQCNFDKMCNNS